MSDINVRADAVDVEQIMRQIRARIREKRGTDYTEAEIAQLASVKLEKFLDPRGIRSDLVQQFRQIHKPTQIISPSLAPPNYAFESQTLYETHRGILAGLRGLLRPILKLFFNPDRITAALNVQAQVNNQAEHRLRTLENNVGAWIARYEQREPLFYEVIHNLTVEVTRLGIEVHNAKMRVESLSSRMDFDERRGRSLEAVVEYRPHTSSRPPANQVTAHASAPASSPAQARATAPPSTNVTNAPNVAAVPQATQEPVALSTAPPPAAAADGMAGSNGGAAPPSGDKRRRRRRRRRRPGQTMGDSQAAGSPEGASSGDDAGDGPDASDADDGPDSSGPAGQ